jgi:hypothetical protein
MKDWDPPLLNQPRGTSLLSAEYLSFEAKQLVNSRLAFEQMRRIRELRESCGVKSEATSTVHIRIPPRYLAKP